MSCMFHDYLVITLLTVKASALKLCEPDCSVNANARDTAAADVLKWSSSWPGIHGITNGVAESRQSAWSHGSTQCTHKQVRLSPPTASSQNLGEALKRPGPHSAVPPSYATNLRLKGLGTGPTRMGQTTSQQLYLHQWRQCSSPLSFPAVLAKKTSGALSTLISTCERLI